MLYSLLLPTHAYLYPALNTAAPAAAFGPLRALTSDPELVQYRESPKRASMEPLGSYTCVAYTVLITELSSPNCMRGSRGECKASALESLITNVELSPITRRHGTVGSVSFLLDVRSALEAGWTVFVRVDGCSARVAYFNIQLLCNLPNLPITLKECKSD